MTVRTLVTAGVAVIGMILAFAAGMAVRPLLVAESARGPSLAPIEVGYLQDMIGHHRQAVTMAQIIDRDGVAEPVRGLARRMVQEQSVEIGTMVGFLQLADEPIENPRPMAWMHRYAAAGDDLHDHDDGAHEMPGMATVDEVTELGVLDGVAAENRFLQLMQRHHYGGVAMTQDLLEHGPGSGPVIRLARSVLTAQTQETGLMSSMLLSRGVVE